MNIAPANPSRMSGWNWIVVALVLLFSATHFFLLPLAVSFDGYLYLDQANMLGTSRFPNDWHFLRTPLFQSLLRASFELIGKSAHAALLIPSALGLVGLWFLFRTLCFFVGQTFARWLTIAASVHPLLLAYQHSLLTEAGTFAFIAATVYLLVRTISASHLRKSSLASLGLVIALGYYFRPTLLWLSPAAAVALLWHFGLRSRVLLPTLGLVVILPFALSIPWRILAAESDYERAQIFFGMANQALLDPDSPLLGAARQVYVEAIRSSLVDGHLTSSGISDGLVYNVAGAIERANPGPADKTFLLAVRESPLRYLKGIIRGLALLLGYPGIDSDNAVFLRLVLTPASHSTQFLSGPAKLEQELRGSFDAPVPPTTFGKWILWSWTPFQWWCGLGSICLLLAIPLSLWKRDGALLGMALLLLGFLGYHAVVLFSLDRMAAPVAPFLVAIPVVVLFRFLQRPETIR